MANARPSARPIAPGTALVRRAWAGAVSLAGAFAGFAAGTAGGAWEAATSRSGASDPPATIAPPSPGARQPGQGSSGVARVLAPASEAEVERGSRQDGEAGPP